GSTPPHDLPGSALPVGRRRGVARRGSGPIAEGSISVHLRLPGRTRTARRRARRGGIPRSCAPSSTGHRLQLRAAFVDFAPQGTRRSCPCPPIHLFLPVLDRAGAVRQDANPVYGTWSSLPQRPPLEAYCH